MTGGQEQPPPPVLVIGGGIAGLSLAIALQRLAIPVAVYDKVAVMRDAGSGMSVIGHSLELLLCLGVDLRDVGLLQHDVTLRDASGAVLFNVPLRSDREMAQFYGSVQFNVHRGELQQALLARYQAEGGKLVTGKKCCGFAEDKGGATVTAHFDDGSSAVGCLLVGADGVHSVVRRSLWPAHQLHYSGSSCWRGIAATASPLLRRHPRCMFKTVTHPWGHDISFTSGWTTGNRCFWVMDVRHPASTAVGDAETTKRFLLKHAKILHPDMQTIIDATAADDLIQTDVYDSDPYRCRRGRVVLIGDAAHPVVHHFGQGACLAIEDAVRLARCLYETSGQEKTPIAAALAKYDTFSYQCRTWALVLISRWCAAFYMHNGPVTNRILMICLSTPLRWLFILMMRVLLFYWHYGVRTFARRTLWRKF